jgi:hypothetical protein
LKRKHNIEEEEEVLSVIAATVLEEFRLFKYSGV